MPVRRTPIEKSLSVSIQKVFLLADVLCSKGESVECCCSLAGYAIGSGWLVYKGKEFIFEFLVLPSQTIIGGER